MEYGGYRDDYGEATGRTVHHKRKKKKVEWKKETVPPSYFLERELLSNLKFCTLSKSYKELLVLAIGFRSSFVCKSALMISIRTGRPKTKIDKVLTCSFILSGLAVVCCAAQLVGLRVYGADVFGPVVYK